MRSATLHEYWNVVSTSVYEIMRKLLVRCTDDFLNSEIVRVNRNNKAYGSYSRFLGFEIFPIEYIFCGFLYRNPRIG